MAIKYIRADATYAERMRVVGARAFHDDGWQLALFPKRLQDPADPEAQPRFMRELLRKRLEKDGVYSIIAVDEDIRNEDGQVRVLGYSAWHAPGKGDNADEDKVAAGDGQAEGGEGTGWVDDGQGGKRGDGGKYPKIMDVEAWWRVNEVLSTTKKEIFGEQQANVWYLGSLGVDPEFAGRGIATQLVDWGIKKSEEDGLPAYLESTSAARGVYARLGFQTIKEISTAEDGGRPHIAMVRKPSKANARSE